MSYYDIDQSAAMGVEDILYLKDIQQRKIYFNAEIMPETVEDPIRHILQCNREDVDIPPNKREPIILYINSDGGDIDAGFSLIDVIQASVTPVYIVNLGWQYSMGFLIGLAGHKRYAMKNAKYLIHDGSGILFDSSAKMQDRMEFMKVENQRLKEFILSHTKITAEEYDEKLRMEWYMLIHGKRRRLS